MNNTVAMIRVEQFYSLQSSTTQHNDMKHNTTQRDEGGEGVEGAFIQLAREIMGR